MTIKRMAEQYVNILRVHMSEEAKLEFRLRKIDERRNYVLDEIKQ